MRKKIIFGINFMRCRFCVYLNSHIRNRKEEKR